MRSLLLVLCALMTGAPDVARTEDLIAHNVSVSNVTYMSRDAVRVVQPPGRRHAGEDKLAVLSDDRFQNGIISGYVSGGLQKDAGAQARGFVGIAFRIDDAVSSFEAVYLRPTNARANDQLRRNHSIQYFSYPEYPWHRLRQESPAKYESYADMVPAEWIHYRLEIDGETARLFLNHAEQPALIVNDLRLGERAGRVGLWIGPGTEGHFSAISIQPR